jgi:hypothetical protein
MMLFADAFHPASAAPPVLGRRDQSCRRGRDSAPPALHGYHRRLVGGTPSHPSLRGRTYRLTVAPVLFRGHRSILDGLNRTDHPSTKLKRPALAQKTAEFAALIEQLQQQKRQLATENAALLKRAIEG